MVASPLVAVGIWSFALEFGCRIEDDIGVVDCDFEYFVGLRLFPKEDALSLLDLALDALAKENILNRLLAIWNAAEVKVGRNFPRSSELYSATSFG